MNPQFDLDHVCRLAHLHLEPEEKANLLPQLEKIVAWVGKLAELPLTSAESRPGEGESGLPLRPDIIQESLPLKIVLKAAADRDENFIKVPRVIEDR